MRATWVGGNKPEYGLFQGCGYEAEPRPNNIWKIDLAKGVYYATESELTFAPQLAPAPELGAKHDTGKARYSLLPRECLAGVIAVLEFGAKKYAAWSWPHVPEGITRYRDALDRHWDSATGTGLASEPEECDKESGLKHAWHFLCCAIFLAWLLVHRPEQVEAYRKRERGAA